MRRTFAVALLVALSSCGSGDRYALRYASPTTLAKATAVQAMAVDGDTLYYGEFTTGDVYRVDARQPQQPVKVGHVDVRDEGADGLMSLAVRNHRVFVSWVRRDRHLVVGPLDGALTWVGPLVNSRRRDGHIEFTPRGELYVSVARIVYDITGGVTKVSDGWTNAFAFTVDANDRMWVADQPPLRGKAVVARGRENDHPKRRRFATGLAGTKPSAVALVKNEVLVCRSNVGDVMRLHIALDNVARKRSPLEGVKCRNGIVAMADGSIITALAHEIRRYPPA